MDEDLNIYIGEPIKCCGFVGHFVQDYAKIMLLQREMDKQYTVNKTVTK